MRRRGEELKSETETETEEEKTTKKSETTVKCGRLVVGCWGEEGMNYRGQGIGY